VQHGLATDIETLGNWLKAINILLVPLLVAACGFMILAARIRRRAPGARSRSS
jgi:hypothetical protein